MYKTKKPRVCGATIFCYTNVSGLIPAFVVTAVATTLVATAAVALKTTAATARTCRALLFRFSFHYFNGTAFYSAVIQFSNCFAGSLIIGHFHKTKSAAFAREFVGDYFGRRYFAILGKKLS